MRLTLIGYGKMGRMIESVARREGIEVVHTIDIHNAPGSDGFSGEWLEKTDVFIDFSTAESVTSNVENAARAGLPIVVGTTGWNDQLDRVRRTVEELGGGCIYSSNFSIGVQVFFRVVRAAARACSPLEDYRPYILEYHHEEKRDAPSGTALTIRQILEESYPPEVPVSSVRAGFFPGIHQVGFDSLMDTFTLEHRARSREGFARGALLAARKGREIVSMADLEEAIDRVVAGLERRSQVLTDEERKLVAYHELGHALVARFAEHADPVHRVSIIPRAIGALGFTQQLPDEERYLMSEPELRDRIAVLMGGRSAEQIVFGFATTGAQDDLKTATEIARRMVMEFGMSDKVGPINVAEHGPRFLAPGLRTGGDISEETEVLIDREVKAILEEARDKARTILTERRRELDELAAILLERESLGRRELDEYFGPRRAEDGRAATTPLRRRTG